MQGGSELLASEAGDRECRVVTGSARIAVDLDAVLLFDRDSGTRFIPADNMEART